MSGVKINPKMLTLARESRGMSQIELGENIQSSHANINRWELDRVNVSEDAFKLLQKALNYPEDFFFQNGEIFPPTFYRKRDKVAIKLLNALDANINIYRLNINKLLKAIGYEVANIPALSLDKYETPQVAAQKLRKKWNIDKGVIDNLTKIMEAQKIIVASINFGTDRVDGRSIFTDDKHPIIFTNNTLLGDRQRFTLAYELGHLVMHAVGQPSLGADVGHEANLFAAEFLMPEKDIAPDFKATITLDLLAQLKKKWKVSMHALLYRASDLGEINYNQQRYLLAQFNQLKIRRREPPELDIQKENPVLLRTLVSNYRIKQKMTLKEMAEFFNLTEEEFVERYS
jgi:Zn-dependent peptidase ImmA (M78 family)